MSLTNIFITNDERSYAYNFTGQLSTLFVVASKR